MRSTFYRRLIGTIPSMKPCWPAQRTTKPFLERKIWTTSSLHQQAEAGSEEPAQQIFRTQRVATTFSVTPVNSETTDVPANLPTIKAKRTSLQNPADHTEDHEGFFYTVPQAHVDTIFGTQKIRQRTLYKLNRQTNTLKECALMIRQPALEIMNYIKKSNMSYPVVRYVLYGRDGAGKTATLAHLLHYFTSNGWIVVHVPRISFWTNQYREVAESTFKAGRIDLPLDSVEWLQHFLLQNGEILKNSASRLVTHKTYVWSKREETPAGSPLLEVVEMGIKRARYANDAIGVLVKELKELASETGQKVGVVMDQVNSLFTPTAIPRVDSTTVPPEILSLFWHFRTALKNDWTNGAIVASVDRKSIIGEEYRADGGGNYLPSYLMRGAAWQVMDPCVPVHVLDYKDKELTNAIDYFIETRWLQHDAAATDKARAELKFVSAMNPGKLRELVSQL